MEEIHSLEILKEGKEKGAKSEDTGSKSPEKAACHEDKSH